jgi:hypothetical protein
MVYYHGNLPRYCFITLAPGEPRICFCVIKKSQNYPELNTKLEKKIGTDLESSEFVFF